MEEKVPVIIPSEPEAPAAKGTPITQAIYEAMWSLQISYSSSSFHLCANLLFNVYILMFP